MAIITRWRRPPESSWGYWSSRSAGRGISTMVSTSSARCAGLRLGHVAVQPDAFGDLLADGHGRVERGHRVLGDQRHLVPPDLAHLLLVERGQVPTEQRDRCRRSRWPLPGSSRMIEKPGRALAAARLPDDPDALALADRERDAVDRHHAGVPHAEFGPEVVAPPARCSIGVSLPARPAPGDRRRPRSRGFSRLTGDTVAPRQGRHVGPAAAMDGREAVAPERHLVVRRGIALVPLEGVGREVLRFAPHRGGPAPPWPAPRPRPPRRSGHRRR